MGKAEVGRLFGIPIVIDATFLLLVVLYGFNHFTSGSAASISYGLALVAGVALSILLHELGHAAAARYYGVRTSAIELNGLGGLCHFERSLPASRLINIVVLLAGPAANLILWKVFSYASAASITSAADGPNTLNPTTLLFIQLANINQLLLFFNLLPAHPLDGGRALAQLLSAVMDYGLAMRIIACLGLVLAVMLGFMAIKGGIFVALIGLVLFQENWAVVQAYRRTHWRR